MRQARRAAPAGLNPEFDFGKPKARFRVGAGDAESTCERNFEPATHAMPMNRSDRRHAQGCEFREDAMSAANGVDGLATFGECPELTDIRTRNEPCRLAGTQEDKLRRLDLDALKNTAELVQNLAREAVDGFSRTIQGEGQMPFGVKLAVPVTQAQAVKHGVPPGWVGVGPASSRRRDALVNRTARG